MKKKIIYPGTFDPITFGHLDIIERAAKMFDEVIVAVAVNNKKSTLFTVAERQSLIKQVLSSRKNIAVCTFSGLLIDLVRAKKATLILRGLRAISDYEYELQLANLNRTMDSQIETVFLMAAEKYSYVSASMVREIAGLGGDVTKFVPKCVAVALRGKIYC